MNERVLLKNSCYVIPFPEKLAIHFKRVFWILYLLLRYTLRCLIRTDMKELGDVVRIYVRDHEAEQILKKLGIQERDATAAVKAATYMHNLTHPVGEITEMAPRRSVRIEKYCPYAKYLNPHLCRDVISGPAFRGLCEAIHPDLAHSHAMYLSGGDENCTLIFEMKT